MQGQNHNFDFNQIDRLRPPARVYSGIEPKKTIDALQAI